MVSECFLYLLKNCNSLIINSCYIYIISHNIMCRRGLNFMPQPCPPNTRAWYTFLSTVLGFSLFFYSNWSLMALSANLGPDYYISFLFHHKLVEMTYSWPTCSSFGVSIVDKILNCAWAWFLDLQKQRYWTKLWTQLWPLLLTVAQ